MNATPIQKILNGLYTANGERATKSGSGWSARCPAHDDNRASLSVAEGESGRALIWCHAGCSVEDICAAVGLQRADLMPDSTSTSTQTRKSSKNPLYRRQPSNGKRTATYDTAEGAIAALECKNGKRSAQWTYTDAQGEPVGVIVRWDKSTGKDVRPVALVGDQWIVGGMPEPRLLYGLPDLTATDRVYICEGEKAADAARAIGLTATTSAHGSKSASKTDWSPLAGKECVILPDNDDAGEKYASDVEALLGSLTPPASVKVVRLPNMPKGGDMADWTEANAVTSSEELLNQISEITEKETSIEFTVSNDRFEEYRSFPTHVLHQPMRSFVEAGAKAIGCDASFLVLPMLSALASAIGNTRRLRLKRGWEAPAVIWTAIIGESGTSKTPAFKLVMQPLRKLQEKAFRLHEEKMRQHEIDMQVYEKELAVWKRDKKNTEPPPAKPSPPDPKRYVVSDTTVEALAPLLLSNPRGLLLARDELSGWLGSFDRYAGGAGGADASHWLSMFNGENIIVDRKTGNPKTIFVPHALISVTGGIQPAILHRALGSEHRESGLAARILLACPPRRGKKWTEANIDERVEEDVAVLFDRLHDLQPAEDGDGNTSPVVLDLTDDAKEIWTTYYNRHANEQVDLSGDLSAAWSKLEEYAARLALVVHCARCAANDPNLANSQLVDAASMTSGVLMAEWFKGEVGRAYGLLAESEEERDRRRLIELIKRKGHPVTAREIQQYCRWLPTSRDAENSLNELVKEGVGFWQPTPSGRRGQPTRRFVLSTVYGNTSKPEENGNTVDVDSVDTAEMHTEDDWGEL